MPNTDSSARGRRRVPQKDKEWFARIIRAVIARARLHQIELAELLAVSPGWLSRAKSGAYGPWPRSVFEEKMQLLRREGHISETDAERYLSEYGFHDAQSSLSHFVHLTPARAILQTPSEFALAESSLADANDLPTRIDDRKIVDCSQVAEALTELKRGRRFILIIGPQACGKSVLARMLAKRLSADTQTYFIDARDITDASKTGIAEELARIDNGRSLLIVEDAHVNPRGVNTLLEAFQESSLSFVITTRPSYKDRFLWNQRNLLGQIENGSVGYALNINTRANSYQYLMESIVRKQLSVRGVAMSPSIAKEVIAASGKDLWALTFLTHATDGKVVNWDVVYNSFTERLRSLNLEKHDAASALLVVAFFWKYEISTPGDFLVSDLKIERETISFLANNGYIYRNLNRDSYFLSHASLAELYVRAARTHTALWGGILSEPESDVDEAGLFNRLLKHKSSDVYEVFRQIRYFPRLIGLMFRDQGARGVVRSRILDSSHSLLRTAELISDIALYSDSIVCDALVENLTPELLKPKLDKEADIGAIAHFIESLPWSRKPSWQGTIDKINGAAITVGAETQEEKDKRLVYCPYTAHWGSRSSVEHELAKIASANVTDHDGQVSIESLLGDTQLCCKSGRVPTICLKGALHVPSDLAISIVESFDEAALAEKIMSSDADLLETAKIISVVSWTHRRLAERLTSGARMARILEKLRLTTSSEERNLLLWVVSRANPVHFERVAAKHTQERYLEAYQEAGWLVQ